MLSLIGSVPVWRRPIIPSEAKDLRSIITRSFLSVCLFAPCGAAVAAEQTPAGLSHADWSQIQRSIQESCYRVEPVASGELQAPNPEQRYRTTFRREGIDIVGGGRHDPWRLSLSLTGYGYEGDVRAVQDAEPVGVDDRVEYRRGPVTEWYLNRSSGLEQGFTIAEPETRGGGLLVLAMAVEGDLQVRIEQGDAASFRQGAGQTRVLYAGLAAWDADGRPLGSRLEASPGEIRVLVEVGKARFPVTVDPVFVQEATLQGHADAADGALRGFSVSVFGDTAIVGAPFEDTGIGGGLGAAHVFVRSGNLWSLQQRLVASDLTAGDVFGVSVSVSGDTAIVGTGDPNSVGGGGSAYVFVRSGYVWNEQQKLTASDGAPDDQFGRAVSVSGDTAIVGAPFGAGTGGSSAYVFVRSGTLWSEQQKLTPSDGVASNLFGCSLSVSGDTALIGAANSSAAYVFVRSTTVWSEQQKLVASDGMPTDSFGQSVSVSGDTALVGAPLDDTVSGTTGSAYVFVRSGTLWSEQQKLTASDGTPDSLFGISVSVFGDTSVVGAPLEDTAGGVDEGSAYVFVRSGTVWSEQQKLVSSAGQTNDYLGASVSVSGDTAVVGSAYDDTTADVDAGSSLVFVRSGTLWSAQQWLGTWDTAAGDGFGYYAVSISGDTVVVGVPWDDIAGGEETGSAYVFVRSGTAWSEQQKLLAPDGAPGDYFGASVSASGDTAVISAPGRDTPAGVNVGVAYVFVRSGMGWSVQQKLLASDGVPLDGFGSVSIAGDMVVVGVPDYDASGGLGAGSAYVFARSGTVWSEQQKLLASDGAPGDGFGDPVSIFGETALVGAAGDDTGSGVNAGSAYVFVRSGSAWSEQQKLVASDGAPLDYFGVSVSVDGDTAVVGAFYADTASGANAGSAYIFVRSGTTWSEQAKLLPSDGVAGDLFGRSVSVAGDTALVGAYHHGTTAGPEAGSVYVFVRSGTVWSEQQMLVASNAAAGDFFGSSLSLSGDTVVVGAPLVDTADGANAGSVYAFRGLTATDASVTKTDGQTSAVPGTPVTYTLTVSDAGPDPGVGLRVVDIPPAAMANVSWNCTATPGSSCPASGTGTIDHTVNLDVGGTLTYTLTGTVSPSATGSLVNTVSVAPPAGVPDPVPANDSATDTDVLTPEADLALSLADSPDPIAPGNTLTYTLQATNLGPSDSSGVTVTDALSNVLTLVSSSPGCSAAGGTVTCALGGSAPNTSQTVTLQAIVNPGTVGSFSNTASLAGNETDPVGSNDTATELTQVSLRELGHGTALSADLGAPGGILADQDLYRIGQKAYSSYEVIVDATSAGIGTGQGPDLERLASDVSTVVQFSQAAGAGSSRSLRWENDSAGAVNDQYVRVRSAGCTTGCTPEDVYRVRAWDTTLLGPRFNNSGTQLTVLVLQNSSDAPVTGHVHFWGASGTLLGSQPVSLAARASLALNTSTLGGAAGQSGSLTLSHDGRYGTLLGKAVSIESATGFTFDTPLVARGR